jgi:hypothetical protein
LTTAAAAPQSKIPIHGDALVMAAGDIAVNVLLTSSRTLPLLRRQNPSSSVGPSREHRGIRKKKRAGEVEGNQIRPSLAGEPEVAAGAGPRWRWRMSRGVRLLSLKRRGVGCFIFLPEKKKMGAGGSNHIA